MNGKQAKRSRATQREIDKHFETIRRGMAPKTIDMYNEKLNALSFRERLGICWKLLKRKLK